MNKERLDQLLYHFISVGVPGRALAVSYKGKIIYTSYFYAPDIFSLCLLDNHM